MSNNNFLRNYQPVNFRVIPNVYKFCLLFCVMSFAYSHGYAQPYNNYRPKSGLISFGNIFHFNSYLKHKGYKQFLDNQAIRMELGYFRRLHDGGFFQWYIVGALGKQRLEFNSRDTATGANTYTDMHFLRPSLRLMIESNLGRTAKMYLNLGYAHNLHLEHKVVTEDGIELTIKKPGGFGQLRGETGVRFLLNEKFSMMLGLGGDMPLGKKLLWNDRKMKLVTNYFTTGVMYRFK